MPAKTQSEPKKKTPLKMSKAQKEKIQKAQEEGGYSNVAVSHTSKQKIMKAFKNEDPELEN